MTQLDTTALQSSHQTPPPLCSAHLRECIAPPLVNVKPIQRAVGQIDATNGRGKCQARNIPELPSRPPIDTLQLTALFTTRRDSPRSLSRQRVEFTKRRSAGLINAVCHQNQIAVRRGINGILNVRGGGDPVGERRHGRRCCRRSHNAPAIEIHTHPGPRCRRRCEDCRPNRCRW